MKLRKLLISALLFSSAVSVMSVTPNTVHAATNNSSKSTKRVKAVLKNQPNMTKQGYVLRPTKDIISKVYVGKANYNKALKVAATNGDVLKTSKSVSYKKVRNVKFRVEKELDIVNRPAGAPLYLVASKDKKYSYWTTPAGMEYYYLHDKSLQPVLKPLKRAAGSKNTSLKIAKNKSDFNQAVNAAQKLHGNMKKQVFFSLKQSQKAGNLNSIATNLMLAKLN